MTQRGLCYVRIVAQTGSLIPVCSVPAGGTDLRLSRFGQFSKPGPAVYSMRFTFRIQQHRTGP